MTVEPKHGMPALVHERGEKTALWGLSLALHFILCLYSKRDVLPLNINAQLMAEILAG